MPVSASAQTGFFVETQMSSLRPSPAEESAFRVLLRLAPLLAPHKWKFLLFSFVLLATVVMNLSGPLIVRYAIDVNIAGGNLSDLFVTMGAFASIQVVYLFTRYWLIVQMETMGQEVVTTLKVRLFRHVARQSLNYFHRTKTGSLLTRIEGDTNSLRNLFAAVGVEVVGCAALLSGMVGVMFAVDWRLALIVTGIFAPVFFRLFRLGSRLGPLFREVRKTASGITGMVSEHIQGLPMVQVYGQEPAAANHLAHRNQRNFNQTFSLHDQWMRFFTSMMAIEAFAIACVLVMGGHWAMAGSLTIGTLVMFVGYIRRVFEPIHIFSEQANMAYKAIGAARRIFELLEEEPEILSPPEPLPWPGFDKAVAFENVSFFYKEDEWVLKEVSFTVPRGEHWAIVGRTGSGKSTLVNLLYRFHDPQQGRLTVDGTDIRRLDLAEWRSHLGLVLQDIQLFPGTVLDNLRMFRQDITLDQVAAAAKEVQAHEFIEAMPEGYRSPILEGGRNLSVGQRQLLSFARALVFDPEILILDEATSAIDPVTEARIQSALQRLWQGRTSIVIAHRLATIMHCDRVLVLEAGRILEQGSPADLVAQGGHFAELHALQQRSQGKTHA